MVKPEGFLPSISLEGDIFSCQGFFGDSAYPWSFGQIIVTSQDHIPNGGLVREILFFSGISSW